MKRELRKALEQERERLVQAKVATDKALQAIETVLKNTGTTTDLRSLITTRGTERKYKVHVYRKRIKKVCKTCKEHFRAKTARAEYCSNACRAAFNNARVKAETAKPPKPATLIPGDPLRAGH